MIIAIVVAALSVVLGASIALAPKIGSKASGFVRTFALIAAIVVVASDLLPEAIAGLGAVAVAVMIAALVVPSWIEGLIERRVGHDHAHGAERPPFAMELGYAGLVLHHIGDGVALYTYGATPRAKVDVVVALAAHTVPVIAVMVLQFAAVSGKRAALVRAGGLFAAVVVGFSAAGTIAAPLIESAWPWVSAIVAGLLLHVIAHDLEVDAPQSAAARSLDLFAAVLGVLIPILASDRAASAPASRMLDWLLECAPPALAGLLASALIPGLAQSMWSKRSRGPLDGLLRALLEPSSPRTATERARSMLESGASPTAVAAFLFAAPGLGMETILLGLRFLGPGIALARLLGTAVAAVSAALVLGPRATPAPTSSPYAEPTPPFRIVLRTFDDLCSSLGPWLFAGCFLAAALESGPSSNAPSNALLVPAAAVLALPLYLHPGALAPAAQPLLPSALGPIVAALIVGPLSGLRAITVLSSTGRPRARAVAVLVMLAVGGLAGLAASWLGPSSWPAPPGKTHGIASLICAWFLALIALRSIWERGARRWIAGLTGK
jgi:uncharacterized membrane protein YraQ (UPF0718 family)